MIRTLHLAAAALWLSATACDDTLYGIPIDDTGMSGSDLELPDDVRQALDDNSCFSCHASQAPTLPAGLVTDVIDGTGEVVQAGSKEDSPLWRVISGNMADGELAMPIGASGPLDEATVTTIGDWIDAGAELVGGDDR